MKPQRARAVARRLRLANGRATGCPARSAAARTRARSVLGSSAALRSSQAVACFGFPSSGGLAPIAFILALCFWLFALIPSGRISFQCQACKQWFTLRKSELATGDESATASGREPLPEDGETYIHREGSVRKADEAFRAWTSAELASMEKAADLPTNPIDRHFLLLQICKQTYRDRSNPEMRAKLLTYARLHLREFPSLAPALKRDFGGTLPRVSTFQNLATVLTEDGAFEEAISVCEAALAHGLHDRTVSGFEGRIARIRRKQERAMKLPGSE